MNYYLVIIQNDASQMVTRYDTLSGAESALHAELAYRGEERFSTVCVILDSNGNQVESDNWYRRISMLEE